MKKSNDANMFIIRREVEGYHKNAIQASLFMPVDKAQYSQQS